MSAFEDYYFGGIGGTGGGFGGKRPFDPAFAASIRQQIANLKSQLSGDGRSDGNYRGSYYGGSGAGRRDAAIRSQIANLENNLVSLASGGRLGPRTGGLDPQPPLPPGGGYRPPGGPANAREQSEALNAYAKYSSEIRDWQDKWDQVGRPVGGSKPDKPEIPSFQDWLGGKGSEWAQYFPDNYDYGDPDAPPSWGVRGGMRSPVTGTPGTSTASNYGPGNIPLPPSAYQPPQTSSQAAPKSGYLAAPYQSANFSSKVGRMPVAPAGGSVMGATSQNTNSGPPQTGGAFPAGPGESGGGVSTPGAPQTGGAFPVGPGEKGGGPMPTPFHQSSSSIGGNDRSDRGKGTGFGSYTPYTPPASTPRMGVNDLFARNRANNPNLPGPTDPAYYATPAQPEQRKGIGFSNAIGVSRRRAGMGTEEGSPTNPTPEFYDNNPGYKEWLGDMTEEIRNGAPPKPPSYDPYRDWQSQQ